ncbi:MAG TPA: energy-coupling factor transporter transmembrane component T [Candidatus Limnocylindrales bacterium]|nr:energy-coupling factor transporter transmembrane component T [Candidatus Limnocylindrales bacterium]
MAGDGSPLVSIGQSPGSPPTALPAFVARPPEGFYRSLNPTTKLVISFAEAVCAFVVRGWTGPLLVLVVVAACALLARIGRSLVPFALATIPLTISILLVNTFLYPGATDRIVSIGPLAPTWSGLAAAVQATLRVVAFALSVAVLGLTTQPDQLVGDLERRGVGRRAIFVIGSTIRMVPRMAERAAEITEAQRARALDTQGGILARVRGVLPLAGPLVFGALTDVEERTMALEARGFSAPGRRTVLRAFPDGGGERLLRWILFLGTLAIIALSVAGFLEALP